MHGAVGQSCSPAASTATDPVGRLLFNVLAMVAEFESDLIRMRTREGLAVAKGRLKGKQPKLTPRQEAHLVALHASGEHSPGELAELFKIGRSTVYRAVQRAGAQKSGTSPSTTAGTVTATTAGADVSATAV